MRSSKYNICLPYEGKFIIFNGVTKRFFQVSRQNKDAFLQILSLPDNFVGKYDSFLKQMTDDGFIVENSDNELEMIKLQYNSMKDSQIYHLMILPTYACNVSCWYCTQHHRNMHLSDSDVELIKKHIVCYMTENQLKGLHLSWFGGEPLLDFHRILELSTFAQKFCIRQNLSYKSTITTNGILLSKERLERMKELNFTFFQITVDGIQEEHDKVKSLKGESAYATTMRNICLISEIIPSAEIVLRYNYTMQNIHPAPFVDDLCKFIPISIRNRITLSLMKIWQENEDSVDDKSVINLAELASNEGFRIKYGSGFDVCYVDSTHFNCIFPNGLIDKCNNQDPDVCRGQINDKGEIRWSKPLLYPQNTVFDDLESVCIDCVYLPVCYGPCPKERDWVCGTKHITCRFTNREKKWKQEIIHYCKNFILRNQLALRITITTILLSSVFLTSFAQTDSSEHDKSTYAKQVELGEVVVKGMSVITYPDKDVWSITREMRKNTLNTYDLLEKIPGFHYDRFREKLTFWGRENILVTIDGNAKEKAYGGNLANIRFKKIEVYDQPEGRFAGYDVVVNLITYENWQGYDFRGLNSTTILPSTKYGNSLAERTHDYTYTYTRPKYDISSNLRYNHRDTRYLQYLDIAGNNISYHSINNCDYTYLQKTTTYSLYADIDYKINKNHTISAKYSFSDEDDNTESDLDIIKAFSMEQNLETERYASNYSDFKNYTISAFYQGKIKKWEINSELTHDIYSEGSKYVYSELLDYETKSHLNNKRRSWLFSLDAVMNLSKEGMLNTGYEYYNKHYLSDEEILNETYSSRLIRNKGYVTFSRGLGNGFSIRIGASAEYQNSSNGTDKERQLIGGANATIRYRGMGNKFNGSLVYKTETKYPTLYQTISIKNRTDPIVSFIGNPLLKASTSHTFALSARSDRIRLTSVLSYSCNDILPEYIQEGTNILRTYSNIKSLKHHSVLSFSPRNFKILGNDLQFHASLIYAGNCIGRSFQKKTIDYWGGQATLGYSINNIVKMQIQYTKMTMKTLSSWTINQRANDFWEIHLYKDFLKHHIECQFSYTLPIRWGIEGTNYIDVAAPYYQSYTSFDSFCYTKNQMMLGIIIQLADGHIVRKKYNEQTHEKEGYNEFIN
jgi:uncharacterized protein